MNIQKLLLCECGHEYRDHAYLILRVVTGLAFFYHGFDKVFVKGVENVVTGFAGLGIPLSGLVAYIVSYGELLGGLALMLGFLTHWVSKFNVLVMLGAIGFVHWGAEGGWFFGYGAKDGYEYQLMLLAVSIFFAITGPGRFSIDAKRKAKEASALS